MILIIIINNNTLPLKVEANTTFLKFEMKINVGTIDKK